MNFDLKFFVESFFNIWKAAPRTLELTIFGFLLGMLIGLVLALIINYKIKIITPIFKFLLSFIRGTPAILQIYIIYYALPFVVQSIVSAFGGSFQGSQIPVLLLVILALALNRGAYLAETIRSGIASVSKGEIEAAYSIGMTRPMVIWHVIFPQTIRICLPNFSTNLINILHGSSLAFYATVIEMTGKANILAQSNWKYFETYLAAGLIYWFMTIVIEVLTYGIEKRLSRHERIA